MGHKSGFRIDHLPSGRYEITYFGLFNQAVQSQTMVIRTDEDLEDLRDHINEAIVKKALGGE